MWGDVPESAEDAAPVSGGIEFGAQHDDCDGEGEQPSVVAVVAVLPRMGGDGAGIGEAPERS